VSSTWKKKKKKKKKSAFFHTIIVKSVIAGLYTAPPAQGPMIKEICGITPEAITLR
jgi:hypothetical protein